MYTVCTMYLHGWNMYVLGCVNLTYLPHEYGISLTFTINGFVLINQTISGMILYKSALSSKVYYVSTCKSSLVKHYR